MLASLGAESWSGPLIAFLQVVLIDLVLAGDNTVAVGVAASGLDDAQRRRVILARLRAMGLPCFEPEGAFYAFPSIAHTGLSSMEFAERLLMEERVAVVPGSGFGQCGEGYIRCCYATAMPLLEEAMVRMKRFVDKL